MKHVYQYIDPKFKGPDDDTRWIAASAPEAAQQYARKHGWLRVNGDSLDGGPDKISGDCYKDCRTKSDFMWIGCDVVLP